MRWQLATAQNEAGFSPDVPVHLFNIIQHLPFHHIFLHRFHSSSCQQNLHHFIHFPVKPYSTFFNIATFFVPLKDPIFVIFGAPKFLHQRPRRLGRPSWSSPEAPEPRPPVLRLWAPGSTWRWLGKVPSFGFHFTHIYPQIHIFSGKILDIKLSNPIFSGKIRFIKLGVMQFKQCHYAPNHHK